MKIFSNPLSLFGKKGFDGIRLSKKTFFLFFLVGLLVGPPASIADSLGQESQLPLPRFASLRSDEVNMRTGPGRRYPIEWVYKRRGLPVEITAEHDIWRRVKDPEGIEGWISRAELTGRRGAVVTGNGYALRDRKNDHSKAVAFLEPGSTGQILSCEKDWCKLRFGAAKGYLRKTSFWGAYPQEQFN